ncbi:unnamed protein product [Brachionus calyciflorus]|uniref:ditrans,polycis-polyprenyl diphosphate synthase [(2E,6E)-farnesyldiphosphate specific] n=1 Tax=Brachionus calyciflorus TaxID=104777 RepID=A0A813MG89_9BILA|nr:unnamed protein product [Brachionus calyciflorus]
MTIQLVQHNHLKTQIHNECLNDLASTIKNRKSPETNNKNSINDGDYIKLYETSSEKSLGQNDQSHKNPFYSTTLFLIQFLINSYFYLKINIIHLYFTLYFLCENIKFLISKNNAELETLKINSYLEQFKTIGIQIPKHVCVILNQDLSNDSKVKDLFSTIINSLSIYGVETITFYKFNEINPTVKDAINHEFFTRDENNNGKDKTEQDLRYRKSKSEELSLNSKKKFNINFFSNENGGNGVLVNACKNIANRVLNNQIDLKDINQDLVDSQVIELSDMTEPQMVLSIGNQDSLSGFSCWHLRLSEIIKIPSYKLVNRITIRDAIIKYNKIEKRFGK